MYEEERFLQKCASLKEKFQPNAKDSLFERSQIGHGDKVPMDGLALFIDKTWETIKSQKELNLPDQRIMVASLRCNELREEAIERVMPLIQDLRERSENMRIENFAD